MKIKEVLIKNNKTEEIFSLESISSYQELKRILDRFYNDSNEISLISDNKMLIFTSDDGSLVQETDLSMAWFFIQVLKGSCKYSGCKKPNH